MDPSTFLGSVWGIIYYRLEGQVPSQTVFGSVGVEKGPKYGDIPDYISEYHMISHDITKK